MEQASLEFMKQISNLYYRSEEIYDEIESNGDEVDRLKAESYRTGLVIANDNDHNALVARAKEINSQIEYLNKKRGELLDEYYKLREELMAMNLLRGQWYAIAQGFLCLTRRDQFKYHSYDELLKVLEGEEKRD